MAAPRAQVIEAVEQLGFRVTVGDLAAQTGLSLVEARQEVQELAQAAEGHLQVSEGGEIAYAFESDLRDTLARKERRSKFAAYQKMAWQGFLYGLRISFGILLLVSIALAIAAITILIMASNRERSGSNRGRSGGGYRGGYGGGFYYMPNLWMGNPFFRTRRLARSQTLVRSERSSQPAQLNFLEAVYSFLFGDGDPNADLEERQDRAIAGCIADNGGVIVAEEALPYLQLPPPEQSDYEDCMLPILVKYDGFPEVSDRGELIYRFPELQITAEKPVRSSSSLPAVLEEYPWIFSQATTNQRTIIIGLGVVNFVLWAGLQSYSPSLASILGISPGLVGFVFGILVLYGAAFLGVPLVRWFTLQRRNQQLASRNQQRQVWSSQLQTPSETLRHKRAFARQFAGTEVFEEGKTIYRSDRDVIEQRDYKLDSPEFRALNE